MSCTITKILKHLPMSHRLPGHEGGCRFLHGHNYIVEVSVRSDVLDSMGMVMDFAERRVSLHDGKIADDQIKR